MTFAPTGAALSLVKAGKIKAIAIGSRNRSAVAPAIPTLAESGLPRFEVTGWYGLLAPAGTPRHIVEKLYVETKHVLETATVKAALDASSLESLALSPQASAEFMKADAARWSKVIRDAGIAKE